MMGVIKRKEYRKLDNLMVGDGVIKMLYSSLAGIRTIIEYVIQCLRI